MSSVVSPYTLKADIPHSTLPGHDFITAGTEAGLLRIYNFPGVVYGTDGSNDKGVMGAGFYRLDENRGGCCKMGRGEEGNSSNRAELGAACLALEDAKRKQDRNPAILFSDSACFLSSS